MSVTVKKVALNGFSMEYITFGSGKTPLVIIPGLSVQSVMPAAEAVAAEYACMASDFTVYLFDRRAEIPGKYPVADMSRDTFAAIDALGIGDFCLFGASQGGMIAMRMALDHPGRVLKLALASTSARVEETEIVRGWISFAKKKDAGGLYLDFGKKVYPPKVFESFRGALVSAAETVTERELERFCVLAEAVCGFDVLDELPSLSCPVLLTWSDDDAVLGAGSASAIAGKLWANPGFETFEYRGYGHAVYDTAPDHRERLRDFFLKEAKK